MHIFFADLNTIHDHGVYSKDNLSPKFELVPLTMAMLEDARIVLTLRFGYAKLRDQILQRIAFYNDDFDFAREIPEREKVAAMHEAVKYLKLKMRLHAMPSLLLRVLDVQRKHQRLNSKRKIQYPL